MHGSSHEGMVLSHLQSLMLPTLIKVKQWVVWWTSSVFASACIALLRWLVLRFYMWRNVSVWWDVQRLHVENMACLKIYIIYYLFLFWQFPKYLSF